VTPWDVVVADDDPEDDETDEKPPTDWVADQPLESTIDAVSAVPWLATSLTAWLSTLLMPWLVLAVLLQLAESDSVTVWASLCELLCSIPTPIVAPALTWASVLTPPRSPRGTTPSPRVPLPLILPPALAPVETLPLTDLPSDVPSVTVLPTLVPELPPTEDPCVSIVVVPWAVPAVTP
jgi:hypothetical protein